MKKKKQDIDPLSWDFDWEWDSEEADRELEEIFKSFEEEADALEKGFAMDWEDLTGEE